MFCPNCGSENKEGAAFCAKCGTKLSIGDPVEITEPVALQPEQQSPSADYDSLGSSYQTPETVASEEKARKSKAPLMVGIMAVLLIAVAGFAFADPLHIMPWNAKPVNQSEQSAVAAGSGKSEDTATSAAAASSEASSASAEKSSASSSANVLVEEEANRISPKESIKVSDLKLSEDSVKRYVLTGKVSNVSQETYDVRIRFSAVFHSSDKYGEETTEVRGLQLHSDVTPYTRLGSTNNELVIYNLAPTADGKAFEFTIYPYFNEVENFISDPTCEVAEVTLPDAKTDWRFDYDRGDKGIKVTSKTLTADGKAVLEFVNNTGLYLNSTKVTFVARMEDGDKKIIPAVAETYGDRPMGALVKTAEVRTLKPGDTGTFECEVGEGYKDVEILDIIVVPDPEKNTFN